MKKIIMLILMLCLLIFIAVLICLFPHKYELHSKTTEDDFPQHYKQDDTLNTQTESISYGKYNPENETVSMIRIISNPDLYDQQKVRIVAVCYFEPKSDMLFLSKDDCKIYNTINGIKLDCNSGILKDIPYFDGLMNSKLNGEYVLIEGTFFKNEETIYPPFCGYLKDVTRITLK